MSPVLSVLSKVIISNVIISIGVKSSGYFSAKYDIWGYVSAHLLAML